MGFAWVSANVRDFGMPEVWDYPPPSPRHRKPRRQPAQQVARFAHGAVLAATAMPRRTKALVVARPALADHRRAF
jgi:hypothetical protein